mgnify:CR=1 FL=1
MARTQNYKDLRVFAEGVRIPANSISRQQSTGKSLSFSLTIPATPVAVSILPNTYITAFVRRSNPQAGIEYSLFAEGRVRSRNINVSNQKGKVINLNCRGLDYEWKNVPLGLKLAKKYGTPREKLMKFFQGLSARDPDKGTLYDTYFQEKENALLLSDNPRGKNTAEYVKVGVKIKNAIRQKGVVVGLAEVVTALYQYGPLLNRRYNASKLYKRFGLINNRKITDFILRDSVIDKVNQQVNAIRRGSNLFKVLNKFLKVSLHEFQSIGSPYFSKKREEKGKKEKKGRTKAEKSGPDWLSKTGEERISAAMEDPVVKGYLDSIARVEVGPEYVGNGEYKRQQSYSVGYGNEIYQTPSGEFTPTKHPLVGVDKDRVPHRVVYADKDGGGDVALYPSKGDSVPEKGETRLGKEVKSVKPTTAVGRYQMNVETWQEQKEGSDKIDSFTPENQDRAAVRLLNEENALEPLARGDVSSALQASSNRWAGLPTPSGEGAYNNEAGGYQKPIATPEKMMDILTKNTARYDQEAAEELRLKNVGQDATIPEAGVMQSLLFKPKTHYEPPPLCNVIFGGEITNANFKENFDRAPTRTMTVARPESQSNQSAGNKGEVKKIPLHFAPRHLARIVNFLREENPFSDLKLSDEAKKSAKKKIEEEKKIIEENPNIERIPRVDNAEALTPAEIKSAKVFKLYAKILEGNLGNVENELLQMYTYEELFRGVREDIRRFPFYSRGQKDKKAAAIYAQHQFGILSRKGRTATVRINLNIDVVPGFPVAIYDEAIGWVIGEPYAIKDQITADGTSMTTLSLYNCVFLADYLNPHYERIYRENESEYAKLDDDGAAQNPLFFDDNYNADKIGDTMYQPMLGQESVIDFSKRRTGKEKISLKEALDVISRAYQREGGQDWLQNVRFRSVATEGQVMQKVLEAYPPEELVQEGDEDIPIRDQIYSRYNGTFSAREIPSKQTGDKNGRTPAFIKERRSWAIMYRLDLSERNHAFAEAEGRTSGTRIQYWNNRREEIVSKWKQDLKTYDSLFSKKDPIIEEKGTNVSKSSLRDEIFRLGLSPKFDEEKKESGGE